MTRKPDNLLFIVGLQKSGTTLLNRLLVEQSDVFFSPFKLEGREFWGDDPPFSPQASPCGHLYQKHKGKKGHCLSINDFCEEHQKQLLDRIALVNQSAPILINKNPYNSVRIGWLKAMFPTCKIVAIVRNPYANVFSLLKKHIDHEGRGMGPEEGWWGVKPKDWSKLVRRNKIKQLSLQWKEVNKHLLTNKKAIDLFIGYNNMCNNPGYFLKKISSICGIDKDFTAPKLRCMDSEYRKGAKLLSTNRNFQVNNNFNVDEPNHFELKKLSYLEKQNIKVTTHSVSRKLTTFL